MAEFIAQVSGEWVVVMKRVRDLCGRSSGSALAVDAGEFGQFGVRVGASSRFSLARSPRSTSTCELTDTYSPAAMAIDPAANPARPAVSTAAAAAPLAATPTIRLAVETSPSLAPNTAARNQPHVGRGGHRRAG